MSASSLGLPVADDVVGYVLENTLITAITMVSSRIRDAETDRPLAASILRGMMAGGVSVDLSILLQYGISRYLYYKVPYFNGTQESNRPPLTIKEFLSDYLFNFTPSNFASAATSALLVSMIPIEERQLANKKKFELIPFLIRLGIFRVVLDIVFYVSHYLLHTKRFYEFHRRHHEHKKTALQTNYHFHHLDLYFEGFFPGFAALLFLSFLYQATGIRMLESSPFESSWMMSMAMWHEIGVHTGKECPGMVTSFPPLALFYNRLWPGLFDKQNVLFHERHHNLIKNNFGITTWLDRLLGTLDMRTLAEKEQDSSKHNDDEAI